ncbi:hypothetical protein FQA39_LY17339 [Lamprigera yunnana]|nr:hypothetical protein FQA39_LY17339 [Lamprigera yunnana]
MGLKFIVFVVNCFLVQKVLSDKFVEGFFDNADVVCENKIGLSRADFNSFYNKEMLIIHPDNELVRDYMKCWSYEKELTDADGLLNENNLKHWIKTEVFHYIGKDDLDEYPMRSRDTPADLIYDYCKKEVGIGFYMEGKDNYFYNCVMNNIEAL